MKIQTNRQDTLPRWLLGVAFLLNLPVSGYALVLGGGGNARTDCLLALDVNANSPTSRPKNVVCVDGDAGCDDDATVNGVCEIPVSVCANSSAIAGCSLVGLDDVIVTHAADDGVDPAFDPSFQALQTRIDSQILDENPNNNADDCTTATTIRVPIKGPLAGKCAKGRKTVEITTKSANMSGTIYTDKDKVKLTCLPAGSEVGGCDAQTLFSGTFDRIQRQIFKQSCAVATCHDSNSTTGGLLLEEGAALTNLVDVTPTNSSASSQGWKRVTPSDSANSFLFRKVTGQLPDESFGARMPFHRAKLNSSLQAVIQVWIDAGAPASGWVPGTF